MVELNEWLAINVMGWEYHVNPSGCDYYTLMGVTMGNVVTWKPNEDISQAFMVVEKMREKGFQLMLSDNEPDEGWLAVFDHSPWQEWKATADTPAMAICLAVQKAVKEG